MRVISSKVQGCIPPPWEGYLQGILTTISIRQGGSYSGLQRFYDEIYTIWGVWGVSECGVASKSGFFGRKMRVSGCGWGVEGVREGEHIFHDPQRDGV